MPPLVTSTATLTCSHGGRVTLIPRQAKVTIQGGMVMCEPDLVGAPIVGCAQPVTPSTKPCTAVIATLPGSFNPLILVGGRPAYLSTLTATTDGVPPGVVIVAYPGQVVVQG